MSGVRVIVNVTMASAEEVDAALDARIERNKRAEATEEGCLQYETFRSVIRPEKLVLLEHWSSYEIYDKHWTNQLEREGRPARRPGSTSVAEFYRHEPYTVVDGIWVPADEGKRSTTVRWAP